MKRLCLILLLLCTPALAKHELTPADFPLEAKVISYEDNSGFTPGQPVRNPNTGVITGTTAGRSYDEERYEMQVGDTIYIVSPWGRGLKVEIGQLWHVQIGKSKNGTPFMWALARDKHGKYISVALEIIGKRMKENQVVPAQSEK